MNFVLNSFSMSRELQENLVNVDLTEPKDQGSVLPISTFSRAKDEDSQISIFHLETVEL